jgi:DNA-binding MarR family transcriptional regulator
MTPDYEIVYSAAMERAATEAIRQSADYTRPSHAARPVGLGHSGERVMRYLAMFPGVTAGHIAIALGMNHCTVRQALGRLCRADYVKPSHRQPDNPRMEIRWRLV